MRNKKILFTGGHAGSTAYAVINEIKKDDYFKDVKLFFVGAKSAIEGKSVKTLENYYLPELGVEYFGINAAKLQRKFTLWTIPSLFRFPIGMVQSFLKVLYLRPQLIISFGGYVALPIVFSSWLLRIPVIIHEQTFFCGLANKLSAPFASIVLISRKKSEDCFKNKKVKLIGNPILSEFIEVKKNNILSNHPLIFVTGGSRGSKSINEIIFQDLEKLLQKYLIIHLTGELDYQLAIKRKNKLPKNIQKDYQIFSVVSPKRFIELLNKSDVVLSRSGANVVSAIVAAKKLSILIPLPFSQNDEQLENAKYAERLGSAQVIKQTSLNSEEVEKTLDYIMKNWTKLNKSILQGEVDDHKASKKFTEVIKYFLQN